MSGRLRPITWSQVRGFPRLYARTRAEQPRSLFADYPGKRWV